MDADEFIQTVRDDYRDVVVAEAWGERGLFYNPRHTLARGTYFVTLTEADGPNDAASALDREGVYRVNVGLGPEKYRELFGDPPARPKRGGTVDTGHDVTELDALLPHPVYAWANWACVLSPSAETMADLRPLLDDAYDRARLNFEERTGTGEAE